MKEGEGRGAGPGLRKVRIWDRPTRIFHWVLVALVVVCYVSGDNGRYDVHVPAGQALLILVLARVLWGFVGSEPSRFRAFVRPPREIASYLRTLAKRAPGGRPGHNPLGGLSVVAMLLVLLLQAGLGLFAVDVDGLHEGPLSFAVSYDAARAAAELHEDVVDVLLVLVGLHLAAILFHRLYKRERLVKPMVTGWASLPAAGTGVGDGADDQPAPRLVSDWRALLVLAAAAAVVLGGFALAQRFL